MKNKLKIIIYCLKKFILIFSLFFMNLFIFFLFLKFSLYLYIDLNYNINYVIYSFSLYSLFFYCLDDSDVFHLYNKEKNLKISELEYLIILILVMTLNIYMYSVCIELGQYLSYYLLPNSNIERYMLFFYTIYLYIVLRSNILDFK